MTCRSRIRAESPLLPGGDCIASPAPALARLSPQLAQMEALDRFTAEIERLAAEQRELSKASTQANRAASRADVAAAKLRKSIADGEEEKQVPYHRQELSKSSLACLGTFVRTSEEVSHAVPVACRGNICLRRA